MERNPTATQGDLIVTSGLVPVPELSLSPIRNEWFCHRLSLANPAALWIPVHTLIFSEVVINDFGRVYDKRIK